MDIKLELLRGHISDYIEYRLQDFEIDADKIADSVAIKALDEIRQILGNENLDDFEVVEKIVCVFEKYNLDALGRHDFG